MNSVTTDIPFSWYLPVQGRADQTALLDIAYKQAFQGHNGALSKKQPPDYNDPEGESRQEKPEKPVIPQWS
jgi:hypothetical protein